MVQGGFSNFTEAPFLLFLCVLRTMTCLIRVPGSDPLFYFDLDFPFLYCACSVQSQFSSQQFLLSVGPCPRREIQWVIFKSSLRTRLLHPFQTFGPWIPCIHNFYWWAKPLSFQLLFINWTAALFSEYLFVVMEFSCLSDLSHGLSTLSAFFYTDASHLLILWLILWVITCFHFEVHRDSVTQFYCKYCQVFSFVFIKVERTCRKKHTQYSSIIFTYEHIHVISTQIKI